MSPEEKVEKAPKERGSAGDQARRLLRNSKAATRDSDGAPTPEAEFLTKQANVMALLELADAVRADKQT